MTYACWDEKATHTFFHSFLEMSKAAKARRKDENTASEKAFEQAPECFSSHPGCANAARIPSGVQKKDASQGFSNMSTVSFVT
jgi:hypothetical protein